MERHRLLSGTKIRGYTLRVGVVYVAYVSLLSLLLSLLVLLLLLLVVVPPPSSSSVAIVVVVDFEEQLRSCSFANNSFNILE